MLVAGARKLILVKPERRPIFIFPSDMSKAAIYSRFL
jgi:hypothetical protein